MTTRQSQTADFAPGVHIAGTVQCKTVPLCLQCFDNVGWVAGRAFGL